VVCTGPRDSVAGENFLLPVNKGSFIGCFSLSLISIAGEPCRLPRAAYEGRQPLLSRFKDRFSFPALEGVDSTGTSHPLPHKRIGAQRRNRVCQRARVFGSYRHAGARFGDDAAHFAVSAYRRDHRPCRREQRKHL